MIVRPLGCSEAVVFISHILFASAALVFETRRSMTSLQQSNYYYWIELEVGTPSQPIQAFIDTGSSDFWVPTADTCNTNSYGQLNFGTLEINCNYTFNPQNSNTFVTNNSDFSISYVSNRYANGYYGQDTVLLGGTTVEGVNLAVADNATSSPVLGISYPYGESCISWTRPPLQLDDSSCTPYSNFPMQLKEQGVTSMVAYSMWLNSIDNGTGSILFDGIDHSKYYGSLTLLPIEKELYSINTHTGEYVEYPEFTRVIVMLTGIGIETSDNNVQTLFKGALPAMLDSGTPTCMVPSSIVAAFFKVLNIYKGDTEPQAVPCGVPQDWNITMEFRGYEVKVPLSQFIRPLLIAADRETYDFDGNILCDPGFQALDSLNYAIVGYNVLGSLYTVFDLENHQVAMAPAVFDAEDDNSNTENMSTGIPYDQLAPSYSSSLRFGMSVPRHPSQMLSLSQVASVSQDMTALMRTSVTSASISEYTSGTGGLSGFSESDSASNTGGETSATGDSGASTGYSTQGSTGSSTTTKSGAHSVVPNLLALVLAWL